MASRREILRDLRASVLPDVPLPEAPRGLATRWSDPVARLAEAIPAVAGSFVRASAATLRADVLALADRLQAKQIASAVPEAGEGNVRLESLADPHEMEGIDLAIVPGVFAVAENGAVWVSDARLRHRGLFVIAQHLALVVPASEIVNDMHEAYERLSFDRPGFGTFIAGPSKTADIEQALVIGAHGARSCTVFLVG